MSCNKEQGGGGESRADRLRAEGERYRAAGAAICRLRENGKPPRDPGWTTASFDPARLAETDNIGVVCGYPSSRSIDGKDAFLVCVDLDSPGVLEKADAFLPGTGAVEGRQGKPRSHRFYWVTDVPEWATSPARKVTEEAAVAGRHPGPWKKAFRHGETKEILIDFQGSGSQVAVPPSIHGSGEVRCWEPGGGIEAAAVLPFGDLWQAVTTLAEAAGAKPVRDRPVDKPPKEKVRKVTKNRAKNATAGTNGTTARGTDSALVKGTGSRIDVPMDERVRRCEAYIHEVDPAVSGAGGHNTTYRAARLIVNDFAVDDEEQALKLMRLYNSDLRSDGEEPWTEGEMRHKVTDALQAGPDPRFPKGCKLVAQADRPWNDPTRLAAEFLQAYPYRFWGGRFWLYTGTHYKEIEIEVVRAELWSHIDTAAQRIARWLATQADAQEAAAVKVPMLNKTVIENVLEAVKSGAIVKGRPFELNVWLPTTRPVGTSRSPPTVWRQES